MSTSRILMLGTMIFSQMELRVFWSSKSFVLLPVGHRRQKLDGVRGEQVELGLRADIQQQIPHGHHKLFHVWTELLFVLVCVETDVITNLRLELFEETGLV